MSLIQHLADRISRLQPGQCIKIDRHLLSGEQSIPMVGICGPLWSPCEQIMEKIVGSSYEFRYWQPDLDTVIFERLKEPLTDGRRTCVSPDRRHLCRQVGDYWLPLTPADPRQE